MVWEIGFIMEPLANVLMHDSALFLFLIVYHSLSLRFFFFVPFHMFAVYIVSKFFAIIFTFFVCEHICSDRIGYVD